MWRWSLVLALSALCLAQATQYRTYTADMDFLHRQKKIFELFFYVDQNTLPDAEFFEIGRNFDMRNSMDLYIKKAHHFSSKLNFAFHFHYYLQMFFFISGFVPKLPQHVQSWFP